MAVQQPKRRGQVKDFCSDRHRAAFRDQLVQDAIRHAEEVLAEGAAMMQEWAARMDGAVAGLARFARKSKRPEKKEKKVLTSDTEGS